MSKPQNWNEMSSSQSEDSWFDDDEEAKPSNNQNSYHTQQQPPASTKQENLKSNNIQQVHQQQKQLTKNHQQIKKTHKQGSNKFATDAELLKKYTDKQVDNPLMIKVVKCFNENIQILKKLNLKRMKEAPIQGMFILQFYQTEDLLKFIEEKMANRYKFYLQLFFKGRPREGGQKRGERSQRNEKPMREERQRRQYDKPRYKNDKEQRNREDNQDKVKQRRVRQQQKAKKTYLPKDYFQITNNKNILTIKNDKFQIQKVYQQLENKNVFNNFKKIKIKTAVSTFSKVSELIYKIGSLRKYFLQEQPKYQVQSEAIVELVIIQNASNEKTNKFYQKYHFKQKNKNYNNNQPNKFINSNIKVQRSNEIKGSEDKDKVQSKIKSKNRLLGPNTKEYFDNLDKSNISQIIKGFDENQFIRQLKQKHNGIFQSLWNTWKIQAQDQQIEQLLKLEHRLKKSNLYDIELKPSSRNDLPMLTIQMRIRPEKQRRPKVDVSSINAILS